MLLSLFFFLAAGKRFFLGQAFVGSLSTRKESRMHECLKREEREGSFFSLFPFPPPPASSAKLDFRRGWLIEPIFFRALNISYICAVAKFDFKAEGDWGEQEPVWPRPYPFTLPPANHHEPQSERKLVPAYPFRTTAPVRYLTVALRLLLMLSKVYKH